MNTVNKSTSYSPFQLCFGRSARVLPPLATPSQGIPQDFLDAWKIIDIINSNVADARDNLMLTKISQSTYANTSRSQNIHYKVGNLVMLSTLNRRRDYKSSGQHRVAKFMPCFDGPYLVTNSFPKASTVTLDIPHAPNLFPMFHTSHIKPFIANDDSKFPSRTLDRPGPISTAPDGSPEYLMEKLIDHKSTGHGNFKYLVRWTGYGPEDDIWISARNLEDNEALNDYLAAHPDL